MFAGSYATGGRESLSDHFVEQTIESLSAQFKRFAERECRDSSDLYKNLSMAVSKDGELLHLAQGVRKGQLAPNIFFAAVHFLLLQGVKHPLAEFYPSITGHTRNITQDPYPYFRAFCLEHAERIRSILATRIVQTNEVRRCACFLPALFLVSELNQSRPFHFVDVGASAGFHLLWDSYFYDYENQGNFGNPGSPVRIRCEIRGRKQPPLSNAFPRVASRLGLELNPIDINDKEEVLWLRALIFPDDSERFTLFDGAVELARQHPFRVLPGDAKELLPTLFPDENDDYAVCFLFSFSVNQMFQGGREELSDILMNMSEKRPVYEVSIGHFGAEYPNLVLAEYSNHVYREHILATCHLHGRWLEWLDGNDGELNE